MEVNLMSDYNTIILKKGTRKLTESEYKSFCKGDTIFGIDSNPEELKRWSIEQKSEALSELDDYQCTYDGGNVWDIEEYALEYCICDKNGEFVQGSDFDLAKEN